MSNFLFGLETNLCILIITTFVLGAMSSVLLLSLALKNARLKTCRKKEMKKLTLIKLEVKDETAYLINDKSIWDCIVVFTYLMFGRFFYKSPLIWKNKKTTKICFISFCVLLILIFGVSLFSLITLHPSTLTPPPYGANKYFYSKFFRNIDNNVCLVFCSIVLAAKSRAFFSIIKLQCLLALVKAVYIISTFNNM